MSQKMEVWGGAECSVLTIGGRRENQVERTGHSTRLDDIDRFAAVGLQSLRVPALWDLTAASDRARPDFSWTDAYIERTVNLGMIPIVGLLHHGTGPGGSLLGNDFPQRFAEYAHAAALRYPHIIRWALINEPLTTARFAGLYGLWHQKHRSPASAARMLVNQCSAIALASRAIKQINPEAQFIQTEDIGKTYAHTGLEEQAERENERRWLTWDLLCGSIPEDGKWWQWLINNGIDEEELRRFKVDPAPPDMLGIDYYPTSERFLDTRIDRYPAHTHGGNSQVAYADLEAVRVLEEGLLGLGGILREAWHRFHIPIAITEVHLGCTREEQMRWIVENWQSAVAAAADGVDVRAFSAWALLGSFDWNSLLVNPRGHYESGVFDIRGPLPRPTALARIVEDIASGREPDYPALSAPGWWRRPARLLYPAVSAGALHGLEPTDMQSRNRTPPLLIIGSGPVAYALDRLCDLRSLQSVWLRGRDARKEAALAERARPWAAIFADGLSLPSEEVGALAAQLQSSGCTIAGLSSDLVFSGRGSADRTEADLPDGTSADALRGIAFEEALARAGDALIVRAGPVFSPWDDSDSLSRTIDHLAQGTPMHVASDIWVSPTSVTDLAHSILDLVIDGAMGVWHITHGQTLTWDDWRRLAAEAAVLPTNLVISTPGGLADGRPIGRYGLSSARGQLLPPLEEALANYVRDRLVHQSIGTREIREASVRSTVQTGETAGRRRAVERS